MRTPSKVLDDIDALIASATPLPWNPEFVRDSIRHLARNVDSTVYSEGYLGSFGAGWNRYHDGPAIAEVMNNAEALVAIVRAAMAVDYDHYNECRGPDGCVCGVLELERAIANLGEAP